MSNPKIDKLLDDSYYHSYPKSEAIRSDLKQALLKDLLGLIGNNTQGCVRTGGLTDFKKERIQNELRDEIRQSITNYINGENK